MDAFLDDREAAKPLKLGAFWNYATYVLLLGGVVTLALGALAGLSLGFTVLGTFAPSVTPVALYPSSSCANSSYFLSVGANATCLTTGSAPSPSPSPDDDTLYDNVTAIVSTANPTRTITFSIGGTAGTSTVLATAQTANHTAALPDASGLLLMEQTGTGFVFVGQTAQDHGSNAGIQQSSLVSNRAQVRLNQYGANTGTPGISTFKSRDLTIGGTTSVNAGDSIGGWTAVGVTTTGTIPLSGLFNFIVEFVGSNYLGTNFALQLVSSDGPINGRRVVFNVNSYGWIQLLESTSTNPQPAPKTPPSGVVVLGAGGTIDVANRHIPANARILLTVQPGQVPVGVVYVSSIAVNTSFTVASTNALDAGVSVYYLLFVPLA